MYIGMEICLMTIYTTSVTILKLIYACQYPEVYDFFVEFATKWRNLGQPTITKYNDVRVRVTETGVKNILRSSCVVSWDKMYTGL